MGQAQSNNRHEGGGERPQDSDDVNDLPDLRHAGKKQATKNKQKRSGPGGATTNISGKTNNQNSQHDKGRYKKRNLLCASTLATTPGLSDRMTTSEHEQQQQQQHVRKLSNVSNRNIQLLSMKPRSERDNFADGLRSRRRSSLINLILGAPSRGPRFSDDLCSLSSHMSELCNFGIDYFPDAHHEQQQQQQQHFPHHQYYHHQQSPANRTASSFVGSLASSSHSRLDDNLGSVTLRPSSLAFTSATTATTGKEDYNNYHHYASGYFAECAASRGVFMAPKGDGDDSSLASYKHHRRRSSLGNLSTFEAVTGVNVSRGNDKAARSVQASAGLNPFRNSHEHSSHENPSDGPETREVKAGHGQGCDDSSGESVPGQVVYRESPSANQQHQSNNQRQDGHQQQANKRPSLASIFMASIDLTSSLSDTENQEGFSTRNSNRGANNTKRAPPLVGSRQTIQAESSDSGCSQDSLKLATGSPNDGDTTATCAAREATVPSAAAAVPVKGRINHNARRIIHRSGSELSLYSATSGCSLSHGQSYYLQQQQQHLAQAPYGSHGGSIASVMLEAGYGKAGRRVSRKMSSGSAVSSNRQIGSNTGCGGGGDYQARRLRETKLIIMLQVCLPFILAGFGNMAAGLVLNKIAQWEAFHHVPIFFVLLPSFVGLKGNIEMTLASRLSTLSNLNLLDTAYQRRHAFLTNLVLVLSQAIGLSLFAAFSSVMCEFIMGKLQLDISEIVKLSALVVLPCALVTSISLVALSSIVMWFAIWLAKRLQVNPDNLSTLMAALYGDVTCVLTYGLFAQLMYSFNQRGIMVWPLTIICAALIGWPILWYIAYKSKETRDLSITSMPPMLAAIMVSLGSGAVLSLVVERFKRIALFQPVVNGFGANLIAVQASRVSTWLWCNTLRRLSTTSAVKSKSEFEFEPADKAPYGSLASFGTTITESPLRTGSCSLPIKASTETGTKQTAATKLRRGLAFIMKLVKLVLWSFFNSSPNSVAARLLLVMLIPAHSLYFIVIWLLSPTGYVTLTWLFYFAYIGLCLTQVFVLLLLCEPMMTFLMSRHLDPDIFGISLLMAMADLIGTLCLTGAFMLLAGLNDPNTW